MQKHHHAAYHFKQKILRPEVKLKKDPMAEKRVDYTPISEPKIKKKKGKERFYISFSEKDPKRTRTINLCSWKGHVLKTEEMARAAKDMIWFPNASFNIGSREFHG